MKLRWSSTTMNLLYNFNTQDEASPSFFEMFLESQMISSLKPAYDYVAQVCSNHPFLWWQRKVLAQGNPRYLPLVEYADEIFFGTVAILERHYLKHYGWPLPLFFLTITDGSFSENFYGLKRCLVTRDGKKGPPLQRRHKLLSIFFLVCRNDWKFFSLIEGCRPLYSMQAR